MHPSIIASNISLSLRFLPAIMLSRITRGILCKPRFSTLHKVKVRLESGGNIGKLNSWLWRDVELAVSSSLSDDTIDELKLHRTLIDIVSHADRNGLQKLGVRLKKLISESSVAAHELWLTSLASQREAETYALQYDIVVSGLLRSTLLRVYGVAPVVSVIPAAHMTQSLDTLRELLAIARETKMTGDRVQQMLNAFLLVHPNTPFEGLRNYFHPVAKFSSDTDYIEYVRNKWLELLKALTPAD